MGLTTRCTAVAASVAAIATPAAVLTHCLAYEVAHRLETVFGPLAGGAGTAGVGGMSTGHHAPTSNVGHLAGSATSAHAGHLPLVPLTAGTLAVAALALLVVVVTVHRHSPLPRPRRTTLLLVQLGIISAIEIAAAAEGRPVVASAVLLAVLAQVPVAILTTALTTRVRALVARLSAGRRPRLAAAGGLAQAVGPVHGAAWWLAPEVALSRGPPAVLGN